jgi:hypothetical protein
VGQAEAASVLAFMVFDVVAAAVSSARGERVPLGFCLVEARKGDHRESVGSPSPASPLRSQMCYRAGSAPLFLRYLLRGDCINDQGARVFDSKGKDSWPLGCPARTWV